jgi:hypothetical protein
MLRHDLAHGGETGGGQLLFKEPEVHRVAVRIVEGRHHQIPLSLRISALKLVSPWRRTGS